MATTLTTLTLLGLVAISTATSLSYFRTVSDLEPYREYQLKQPVLGDGRNQDCKWRKDGETIMQSKFATKYLNMGVEKGEYDSSFCVLKIVTVNEDADNGSLFSLEFKGHVFQITTYMIGEPVKESLEQPPNRLDEMTQSMMQIVYIALGVFVAGCIIFAGLMKCA
ncbi:Hypothetical predicted protein [Cloeon dipterum]|uniref:Uncharacterized protein n=1 Tax=Cloeon dipterum TaxID=197152 RepID=A0A8S1CJC0_9INSE|nr:Hypothetical predicted protein [Cloeon dipterum]